MTGEELRERIVQLVRDGQPMGLPSEETADAILELLHGKRLVVMVVDAIPNSAADDPGLTAQEVLALEARVRTTRNREA